MTWKGVNGVKNVKLICKKLNIIVAKNKVNFLNLKEKCWTIDFNKNWMQSVRTTTNLPLITKSNKFLYNNFLWLKN